MAIYSCLWPCIVIYGYIGLCMAVYVRYGYMWLSRVMCG